jgi:hypothetical protein
VTSYVLSSDIRRFAQTTQASFQEVANMLERILVNVSLGLPENFTLIMGLKDM